MAGMDLFLTPSAKKEPESSSAITVENGDAVIVIKPDLTYEVALPSATSTPTVFTNAAYAAVGLVMELEDNPEKLVERTRVRVEQGNY